MNTDLDQLTDLEALPVENTFSNAVLPLAAAALQGRSSRKVLELVALLDSRHAFDSPLDRLVVFLYAELRSLMVAHYENGRPPLSGLKTPEELERMDQAVTAVVRALAGVPGLPGLVRQVRDQALRAEDVLGPLRVAR